MRLIDADDLIKKVTEIEELAQKRVRDTESTIPHPNYLNPVYIRYVAQMDERANMKYMIADAKTVDDNSSVRGRWVDCDVYVTYKEKWQKARCSHCDHYHITPHMMHSFEHFKYCPYCGARMEE